MDISELIAPKQNPKIREGDKERIQLFQGVVVRVRHGGTGADFTVRRVTYGIGVERTFPIFSPLVEKVEVSRHGKVRRARLYYLRGRSARASRIKERRLSPEELEQEQEAQRLRVQEQEKARAQAAEQKPEEPPAPAAEQKPAESKG
jgi:large subunit ribosomal protein L19